MYVTEKEAADKWCPMTRICMAELNEKPDESKAAWAIIALGDSFNRLASTRSADVQNLAASKCLGSKCMMWRWQHYSGNGPCNGRVGEEPKGRCGMAGL